jgi:hypothetical protein
VESYWLLYHYGCNHWVHVVVDHTGIYCRGSLEEPGSHMEQDLKCTVHRLACFIRTITAAEDSAYPWPVGPGLRRPADFDHTADTDSWMVWQPSPRQVGQNDCGVMCVLDLFKRTTETTIKPEEATRNVIASGTS